MDTLAVSRPGTGNMTGRHHSDRAKRHIRHLDILFQEFNGAEQTTATYMTTENAAFSSNDAANTAAATTETPQRRCIGAKLATQGERSHRRGQHQGNCQCYGTVDSGIYDKSNPVQTIRIDSDVLRSNDRVVSIS